MNINDRVKKIRESLNLEKSAMSRLLKMTPQTYGTIENNDNGLSMANFQKFASAVPSLNLRWFLLGEGNMFYENSDYETMENREATTDLTEAREEPPTYEKKKETNALVTEEEVTKKQIELLMIEMKRLEKKVEILEVEVLSIKRSKK
jgi:transcriptional regulator with XRE-family HTH domain